MGAALYARRLGGTAALVAPRPAAIRRWVIPRHKLRGLALSYGSGCVHVGVLAISIPICVYVASVQDCGKRRARNLWMSPGPVSLTVGLRGEFCLSYRDSRGSL